MPFRSCQPLILLVLLTGWGCGSSDGPQRVPLHGVITAAEISGPLTGTISLQPVSGTSGPAANGMITDGQYQFSRTDGPAAGSHRVLIDVEPPRGKMDRTDQSSTLQWKFEFRVDVPQHSPWQHDFELIRKQEGDSP